MGEGLRASGVDRSEVFLETKLWISDYGYDQALHGFEKSAAKLGVDQIDLLLLHQPLTCEFEKTIGAYKALETLLADGCTPAQVMLRWGLQQSRSVIPKSVRPERIAENLDVFRVALSDEELARIDALETGERGGPDPDAITLETFTREIPEA